MQESLELKILCDRFHKDFIKNSIVYFDYFRHTKIISKRKMQFSAKLYILSYFRFKSTELKKMVRCDYFILILRRDINITYITITRVSLNRKFLDSSRLKIWFKWADINFHLHIFIYFRKSTIQRFVILRSL